MHQRVKAFFIGIVALFFCFIALSSYAWNALAHMVVAQIAYDRLKPEVKLKVDKMTQDLGKEYAEISHFDYMGPWPDTLRSQKINNFTHWHYIDMPFTQDGTPLDFDIDTDNVSWAINQIKPVVANSHANPYERARFLAFLVHIVADVHQPLHTVTRISSALPQGDRGGNLYYVLNPVSKSQTITLHKLWDRGVDAFMGESSLDRARLLTKEITASYPEKCFLNEITDSNLDHWADEGMRSAVMVAYATPQYQLPSDEYIQKGRETSREKIALAGYRLAAMLNALLG